MLLSHLNNIRAKKVSRDYGHLSVELDQFERDFYWPFANALDAIDYTVAGLTEFERVCELLQEYYDAVEAFSSTYSIKSQSKFRSTVLEEFNSHLFARHPVVDSLGLEFLNKRIYAGLKLSAGARPTIIPKDVDFCYPKGRGFLHRKVLYHGDWRPESGVEHSGHLRGSEDLFGCDDVR